MLLWQSIAFVFDTYSLENATIKKLTNLAKKLTKKNKLAHWGQLSGKINSLICWELGNTVLQRSTVYQMKVRNLLALYDKSF